MNLQPAARFLLLVTLASPAFADQVAPPVESHISAVTVYADRAVVTRTASIDVPVPGPIELLFDHLPASLQASGRGTAQSTILDVSLRNTYHDRTPDGKLRSLEDELRSLERQKSSLDDSSRILDEQAKSLVRVEGALTTPPTKDSARPTIEELAKLLTFLQEQRSQIASAKATLANQVEQLTTKIEALENQLRDLQQNRVQSTRTVAIRLNATTAGKLELTLNYSLTGANWSPAYDARLRAEERGVDLAYYGLVRNATGENWSKIALTLSTARPSRGGGAPDLPQWVVDVPPSTTLVPFSVRGRQKGAADSSDDEGYAAELTLAGNRLAIESAPAAPGSAPEQDADTLAAAVDTKATSATFRIPVAVTVPSDGTIQKVGVSTLKFAANLQFESTPKLNESVFLHAYATNTSDYPLLAGPMNTFLDGTFVASSRLNTVMAGEKFVLALGADEGVALKRRLVNRFSEDTGLTSRTKRITYDYLFTVTNNKKTPERIVFKDAVPVSRNEKIVVKILLPLERDTGTIAAPKEVSREEDGRFVWRFELKPGEKREIPFKFSVEYPADTTVTGLE